jgi:hypothetical protein
LLNPNQKHGANAVPFVEHSSIVFFTSVHDDLGERLFEGQSQEEHEAKEEGQEGQRRQEEAREVARGAKRRPKAPGFTARAELSALRQLVSHYPTRTSTTRAQKLATLRSEAQKAEKRRGRELAPTRPRTP